MTVFSSMRTAITMTLCLTFMVVLSDNAATAQDYKETFNEAREAVLAKDYPTALTKYTDAAAAASVEGDDAVERKARKTIASLEYILGRGYLKSDDFDSALAHFDNGISNYPSYAKNYLARASTLKKMDRMDDAITGFAQTMDVATTASDTKTARQAEDAIRGHFVFLASTALSRNGARTSTTDANEAMDYIITMLQYVDPDADAFYYMAESQKVKGQFHEAVMSADEALAVHTGSRTDKAKIYFVKGEALMNMGDVPGAKEAFRNAAFGNYKNSAEHFIEMLGSN